MSANLKATAASAAFALSVLAVAPASALTVGAPGTSGNFIPFGSIAGYPEYQQVYASSAFAGTIKIDDLEFYVFSGTGAPNTGVVKITLSETNAQVNALSTTLSQNFGSSSTVVYDATLPAIQSGVLDIPFSTLFTYNPPDGNLLVDIYESSPYTGGPGFAFNGASGGLFSRGFSGQTISVANNSGLVTGFSTTIPEPATWALMGLGFAMLGFAGYRAPRRAAVKA